jgi:hypothetical protein
MKLPIEIKHSLISKNRVIPFKIETDKIMSNENIIFIYI